MTVSENISFSESGEGHRHKWKGYQRPSDISTGDDARDPAQGAYVSQNTINYKDHYTEYSKISLTKSGSVTLGNGDAETRPQNATLTVWLRTA